MQLNVFNYYSMATNLFRFLSHEELLKYFFLFVCCAACGE